MQKMPKAEMNATIKRYHDRYCEFGYSPKSLGWGKGKQDIRFDILTSLYDCRNKTVLDIGCGFGDLNITLEQKFKSYRYLGCDLCEDLVAEGRKRYPNAHFLVGDFLELSLARQETRNQKPYPRMIRHLNNMIGRLPRGHSITALRNTTIMNSSKR